MAGLNTLNDFLNKNGREELISFLTNNVKITEKFDAHRFSFDKSHNDKIRFFGKNGDSALSRIDRTITDLYENAISTILNIPENIKNDIPNGYRFGFSWFPKNKPLSIKYDKVPKNGLILTDISIRNKNGKIINEIEDETIIKEWCNLLGVEYAPPIFNGILKQHTIDRLLTHVETDKSLSSIFENEDFIISSHLQKNEKSPIEAIIFENQKSIFKIEGVKKTKSADRNISQMFDVLLLDIYNYVDSYQIKNIVVESDRTDNCYIEAVCQIFNQYVTERGEDFLNFNIEKPHFLKNSNLNKKWITDKFTQKILEKNSRYEYLLSIFLTNLRKPKNAKGLLNEKLVNNFNKKIDKIFEIVNKDDDYCYLEFKSIVHDIKNEQMLKEFVENSNSSKIENGISDGNIDQIKLYSLLQTSFEIADIKKKGDGVNVVIVNATLLPSNIIDICEQIKQKNDKKCLIIHCNSTANKTVNVVKPEKIMGVLVIETPELFCDFKVIDNLLLEEILAVCRPEHEPETIYTESGALSLQMQINGYMKQLNDLDVKEVNQIKISTKDDILKALETNSYLDFIKLTYKEIHPYWTEIYPVYELVVFYSK